MFKSKRVIFDSTPAMFHHKAAEFDLFEKIVQTAVNFAESQPEQLVSEICGETV